MASSYNIEINQGETYSNTLIGSGSAAALNLVNYTATGSIRSSYGATGVLYHLTGLSIPTGTASLGYILLDIPYGATAALPAGELLYDIEVYSGQQYYKASKGKVIVNPEISY